MGRAVWCRAAAAGCPGTNATGVPTEDIAHKYRLAVIRMGKLPTPSHCSFCLCRFSATVDSRRPHPLQFGVSGWGKRVCSSKINLCALECNSESPTLSSLMELKVVLQQCSGSVKPVNNEQTFAL